MGLGGLGWDYQYPFVSGSLCLDLKWFRCLYVVALTLSLSIVEANPKKFNLDAMELAKRKAFITSTRQTVRVSRFERLTHICPNGSWISLIDFILQEMKDHMASPMAITVSERKNRQVCTQTMKVGARLWFDSLRIISWQFMISY